MLFAAVHKSADDHRPIKRTERLRRIAANVATLPELMRK